MEGLTRAPALDRPGLHWLNTPAPLDLKDLRGKLVILDFWTYCCINCIHMLPTLARVEEKFPDTVVVIGVHSPKFAAERDVENVEAAIRRLGVHHPVIHDPNMILWREYAIRAWPTLTFISPDGMVIGNMQGEAKPESLLLGIGNMLKEWRVAGQLQASPPLLSSASPTGGRLAFPGKIKPVPGPEKRWALADSGHHQIVLLDDDGVELERIGSGKPGLIDADKNTSAFCAPQGLVATERHLYVADTGNHAIRRIDLDSLQVQTLAGTGERGIELKQGPTDQPGSETALASPWDLEQAGETLYFANAGSHQIGQLDLITGAVSALAGTGGENIIDGAADAALLAQPSGLAIGADGRLLYFVDSETSSVRVLDLQDGSVDTLVGTGLFDFGTQTGSFADTRLQHPLGLACMGQTLVVADSFNDRLCRFDLPARQVEAIDIAALTCTDGLCTPLGEPAGVALDPASAEGAPRLLVGDSNNHRILEIYPEAGTMRTWAA